MSYIKSFGIVIASGCLFGLIGAAVGTAIGMLVPGYYRSVFFAGDSPHFDPVQVGFGQGVTQGFAGGVVIGIAILLISALRIKRTESSGYCS